jgi:hypothetical protein
MKILNRAVDLPESTGRSIWNDVRWIMVVLTIPVAVWWASYGGCSQARAPEKADRPLIQTQFDPYQADSSSVGGRVKGDEVLDADPPNSIHMKNIGSKVDNAGMCVTTSAEINALWQNLAKEFAGFRDYCANDPGGSYPQKMVEQLDAYAKQKGIANIRDLYVQYEGPDPYPIVQAALKSGRMACITYGTSPRYNNKRIAHMVCCVKAADGQYAAILDNNFPGEDAYEWMTHAELKRRITYPDGVGWVFVWLAPPPPPSPRNPK